MASVKVDELVIHYLAPRGLPTSASNVVLLAHGIGGSSAHFKPLITHLAQGVLPVAVDLPGHGDSGGVVLDSAESLAHFLDVLLSALHIDGPVCYIGHSFSGLIGLKLALLHPERLRCLVLIATAAKFRLHPDFLEQASSGRWNLKLLRESFAAEIPEEQKQLILRDFPRMRVQAGSNAFINWGEEDLRPHLGTIRVPTLVVVPDHDVILSPRHGRLLAREISGARLFLVRSAGHYVHVEQPELLADQINAFLQGEPAGGIL